VHNCARVYEQSVDGLIDVLDRFDDVVDRVAPQGEGRSFTTPSFRQFLRMSRNHRQLLRSARA
ncbi:MAG TPA: hypothetical protein VJ032_01090, partial [Thermoanaerobaculia bacterium]|nr:hypothetical protein [Thermoanaerobaculia bacterium]